MKDKIVYTLFTGILSFYMITSCTSPKVDNNEFKGKIGKTLEESEEWWPEKKQPPADAPNVIWVLLDDVGFGAASAFGGLIETPTLDSLANEGLRFTNFHTTSICSPTRAALLTGRNAHSVHMGLFPVTALGFPGYDGRLPEDKATIAEILHENSYNTYAVGKWHLTPIDEITAIGPFDRWPTGKGFDHFYGWHLGHTDQYHPNLYEDNNVIDIEPNEKHVTTLITDKAIKYIANQKSLAPDKPFFLYYAPGALHYPHQVDKKWIDFYKGKFDKGWDWYREETIKRQKTLGVIPADAELPARHPNIPAWESLDSETRRLYSRYMEVYAAFLTHADYEFGRLVSYLKEINQLENTVIFAVVGDNGASPSSQHGSIDGHISSLDENLQVKEALKRIDDIGTEKSFSDAPYGWTQATNVPFRLWKTDAQSEGGTNNPLIVFYPKGIKEKGGVRRQYGHVNDLAPTILELIGGEFPKEIKGHKQKPFEGTSLFYAFNDKNAADQHKVQYYEIAGKRSIYVDGWKAATNHTRGEPITDDNWELYHLAEDFNERFNVADKHPKKLQELIAIFDQEAKKYNVYPLQGNIQLGSKRVSAFNRDEIILYPGIDQLLNFAGPQFIKQSFSITADVSIAHGDQGVLFSTGGAFDGLSLFIQGGKFLVANNTGGQIKHLESQALSPGKYKLTYTLDYVPPKNKSQSNLVAPAGTASLYIDGTKAVERPITAAEIQYIAKYKDGVDVGRDLNSPVSDRYTVPFAYTGKLHSIRINYL